MADDPPPADAAAEADAVPEGPVVPEPGVESLFLTGTTLKLVGIEDMGDDLLYKAVPLETITHDMQFRGAISDFHPSKAKIVKADYDPIMFRYNADDKFGDGNNFEVCLLKETADKWAAALESIEREKAEKAAAEEAARLEAEEAKKNKRKPRKPKPWVSQGSEAELEEAQALPTREVLVVQLSRRRRDFKQSFKFSDKDSQELWNSSMMECRPYKDPNFELRRLEQDVGVQAVAELTPVAIQATAAQSLAGATQYSAQDCDEEEKKKACADPLLTQFLERSLEHYEYALQQNEVMDIFEDAYACLAEEDGGDAKGSQQKQTISPFQSFTDLTYSKGKLVKAIAWVPQQKGRVAVACTQPLTFDERLENAGRVSTSAILLWSFSDPIHPQYVLEAPFDVYSFGFNPKKPEFVTGGLHNGQIIFWNTTTVAAAMERKKREGDESGDGAVPVVKPQLLSAVENSHNGAVTDLKWLPGGVEVARLTGAISKVESGEANQFCTMARDGRLMFWDLRVKKDPKKGEIIWTPVYQCTLNRVDTAGDLAGYTFALSFMDELGLSSNFFATSLDGELALGDFVKPADQEHPDFTKRNSAYHYGPVIALQRSPFFKDILLTAGDWTFKIWKEDQQMPLFSSGCSDHYLTAAAWSPTRPGVLYTAKEDGTLEVWDLLDRSHEASVLHAVSSASLESMQFWPSTTAQQLLAVGDGQGVLHILELPRNLRRPVPNEKEIMQRFFERELQRVQYVAARAIVRQGEASATAAAKTAEAAAKTASKKEDRKKNEGELAREEEEYKALEREFKIQLGLISDP